MDIKELLKSSAKYDSIPRHPWELARAEIITTMIQKLSFAQNIYDIGSGDAFLINYLSKHFSSSHFIGIDSNYTSDILVQLNKVINNQQIAIYSSLHEAFQSTGKKADMVLMLDVLEHIEDEDKLFSSLKQANILKKETVFVITVPAFNMLFSAHDLWLGHYRRYDRSMLVNIAKRHNFRLIESGYFFFSLVLSRLIAAFKERIIKPDINNIKGVSNWKANKIKDACSKWFLLADYHIGNTFKKAGIPLPGLSCYMICQKKA